MFESRKQITYQLVSSMGEKEKMTSMSLHLTILNSHNPQNERVSTYSLVITTLRSEQREREQGNLLNSVCTKYRLSQKSKYLLVLSQQQLRGEKRKTKLTIYHHKYIVQVHIRTS